MADGAEELIDEIAKIVGDNQGTLRKAIADKQLEDLNLDFTILCTSRAVVMELGEIIRRYPACGRVAGWLSECVACGAPTYLCETCKVRAENRFATGCGACMAQGGPSMWRFTPIGGAA